MTSKFTTALLATAAAFALASAAHATVINFNGAPDGTPWTAIETANNPMTYVASFQNLGNAAPQGVQCASTADVLNGSCLFRLKDYIRQTGGQYFNPGNVPPP